MKEGAFLAHIFHCEWKWNSMLASACAYFLVWYSTKSDVWKHFLETLRSYDTKLKIQYPWLFPRDQNYPSQWGFHMWKVCPALLAGGHWKPRPSFSVPQMDQIYNSAIIPHKVFEPRKKPYILRCVLNFHVFPADDSVSMSTSLKKSFPFIRAITHKQRRF